MSLIDLSMKQLLLVHNHLLPEAATKKFSDKESAVRRTSEAIKGFCRAKGPNEVARDYEIQLHPEATDEQLLYVFGSDDEPEAEAKPEANPEPKGARGRKPGSGKLNGKTLKPLKQVNPRRAGTKGWHSFNILLAHPDGIEFGKYIAAGGRANDAAWDIEHKHAKAE